MTGSPKMIAAAVGGLVLLVQLPAAHGQSARSSVRPVVNDAKFASLASGSIGGVVQDERGAPIPGAMVSALGATRAFAVTDRSGRFELRTLLPGPYLVRAHLGGFVASRGQMVDVRPSSHVSSSIALRRAPSSSLPVLAAGVGTAARSSPEPAEQPAGDVAGGVTNDNSGRAADDDHGETAWRLRHARRSILKDARLPEEIAADRPPGTDLLDPRNRFGRAV